MSTFEEVKEAVLKMSQWMTLTEASSYINSGDYLDRLKGETLQLGTRIYNLKMALRTKKDPLLIQQLKVMNEYLDILCKRLANEDINW